MNIVIGHDAIHANIGRLPPGQSAGYTTGSPSIRWTDQDWAAHPGAVRICQDSGASDRTADWLDVERGAATNAEAPSWAKDATHSFETGQRPGQRWPGIYTSASNVTPLVDALIAGGVTQGVFLFVANWNLTEPQAAHDVLTAAGPFPIGGMQYASLNFYDVDVFSSTWLAHVSVSQSGSTPHKTVAGDTLGSLAASRNMDVFAWLGLQQRLSQPQALHLARHAAPEPGSTWRSL